MKVPTKMVVLGREEEEKRKGQKQRGGVQPHNPHHHQNTVHQHNHNPHSHVSVVLWFVPVGRQHHRYQCQMMMSYQIWSWLI